MMQSSTIILTESFFLLYMISRLHRRNKDKKDEPEADPERDQRTVFAYQVEL